MASKTRFVCSSCGYESGKWLGRCPDCSAWNTFAEVVVQEVSKTRGKSLIDITSSASPVQISKVKSVRQSRISTGFSEFDRVLGGGVVAGSVVLLSGDPGIGKSTLLLEIAINVADRTSHGVVRKDDNRKAKTEGPKVLYITGEESESQVKLRAERILGSKRDPESLFVFSTGDIEAAIAACEKVNADLIIVDSIQTMATESFPGFPGSLPQIRHSTSRLVSYAKKNSVPVFLIGHVTKEGIVAGPMLLSHMVDTVLYLEGESLTGTKILRSFKNRFGDTSEVGIFTMEEVGLVQISDTANFFMENAKNSVPGSCLTVVMEGSRPIIVEIQALVVPSNLSFPRRVSNGISEKRLELLLAVIQKHLKTPLDRMDVFVNVVGGLKITETAADFAVCMAILSSFKNKALPGAVAIAEVGLLGELKKVLNESSRIKEAKKLGFKRIYSVSNFRYLSDIIRNLN
ncbi:MAG: DNA repair protein RadA [Candidatus Levybacteria bacterium RIFCSPHIGHO2_01_FULL_40_10]|nr:MAG: DNA repair protein RadA [Candidatus Levybacteria bacterium RIFCSPHIGHO2_01_FULL_40_10]